MMKIRPTSIALAVVAAMAATACGDSDSTWTKYGEWYEENEAWFLSQLDRTDTYGDPYYKVLNPSWNPTSNVLIRYHNDTTLTRGNLSPMQTSTVAVKYKLELYNGIGVDSSYSMVDSLATFAVNGLVAGWQVALNDMHCGDSVTVVIPYQMGYGATGSGLISPYSTLKFDIKLVDIPYYEVPEL